jgi:4-hydroxy-2-oxoheptanedioate aldolase
VIVNTTKAKLEAGETVFGIFDRYRDATLAEFIALGGWDFLVFDAEHGALDPADVADLSRAAEVRGATPMARVTTNESSTILRFLDSGVHGVHVPWVSSAEEAERVVQAVKYGPRGRRGLAGNRSGDWSANAASTTAANEQTLVVVQVETAEAVDRIDELTEVEGVDVVFLGPSDLSHSLGHPGDLGHPEVRAAMERVAAAVVPSAKTLGVFTGSVEAATEWRDRGARYLTTGLEQILRQSIRAFLEAARG